MQALMVIFSGGCSSVGRVPDCDSGCRGFEPHQPPHYLLSEKIQSYLFKSGRHLPNVLTVAEKIPATDRTRDTLKCISIGAGGRQQPISDLMDSKGENLAWVGGADADRLGQLPAALQHPAAASEQDDEGSGPPTACSKRV